MPCPEGICTPPRLPQDIFDSIHTLPGNNKNTYFVSIDMHTCRFGLSFHCIHVYTCIISILKNLKCYSTNWKTSLQNILNIAFLLNKEQIWGICTCKTNIKHDIQGKHEAEKSCCSSS